MAKIQIEHVKSDELHPLFARYRGQTRAQWACIELDLISGKLWAAYAGEAGRHFNVASFSDSIPAPVWHGQRRQYEVTNILVSSEINYLLDHIAPLAQRVLDGTTFGDHSESVSMPDDAEKAEKEIGEECDEAIEMSRAVQYGEGVWEAESYYDGTEADEMGLTPGTTDEQLSKIIEEEKDAARRDGRTIDGVEDYLENELKTLRENKVFLEEQSE